MSRKYIKLPLVVTLILLISGVILLYGMHHAFTNLVADYRDGWLARLETELGYPVSYESISPLLLRSIEIHNVHVGSVQDPILHVEKITIRIHPLNIIRRTPNPAVNITISNSSAWINRQHIRQIENLLFSAPPESPTTRSPNTKSPASNINLSIQVVNLSLYYHTNTSSYVAHNVDAKLHYHDHALQYHLDANVVRHNQAVARGRYLELNHALPQLKSSLNGTHYTNNRSGTFNFQLNDFAWQSIRLRPQSFMIQYTSSELKARNMNSTIPYTIEVNWLFDTNVLTVALYSKGMVLDSFLSHYQLPSALIDLVTSTVSFRGDLTLNLDTNSADYQFTMNGTNTNSQSTSHSAVQYNVNIKGDQSEVNIYNTGLYLDSGSVLLSALMPWDTFLANGELIFNNFSYYGDQQLNGVIYFKDSQQSLEVISDNFMIAEYQLHQLHATIDRTPVETNINLLVSFDQESKSTLSIVTSLPRSRARNITTTMLIKTIDPLLLINIGQILGGQGPSVIPESNFYLDVRLVVVIDANTVHINIPKFDITNKNSDTPLFTLWGSGTTEEFKVKNISLFGQNATAIIDGTAVIARTHSEVYDLTLNLASQEFNYLFNVRYKPNHFVRINGSYGLYALIFLYNSDQYRFNIRSDSIPLYLPAGNISVNMNAEGFYRSSRDWEVRNWLLSARNLSFSALPLNALTMKGYANQDTITARSILIEDHLITTSAQGNLVRRDNSWNLTIESSQNELQENFQLTVDYDVYSRDMLATAKIAQLSLKRFDIAALGGAIESTARLRIQDRDIEADISMYSVSATYNTYPLIFNTTWHYHDQKIKVLNLDAEHYGYTVTTHHAEADLKEGLVAIEASLVQNERRSIIFSIPFDVVNNNYPLFNLRINTRLNFNTLNGKNQLQTVNLRAEHVVPEGTLPLLVRNRSQLSFRPFVLYGQRQDDAFVVEAGYEDLEDLLTLRIDQGGALRARSVAPFPLQFNANGIFTREYINIAIYNIMLDTAQVPRLADLGFLRFTAGYVTGEIQFVGSAQSIQTYGSLFADQTKILVTYVPDEIGPASSFILFQGREIVVSRLFALVGEEYGAYFEARFTLFDGILQEYVININTPLNGRVPFAYDFGVVNIDAIASGNVTIVGKQGNIRLAGEVKGEGGFITIPTQIYQPNTANVNSSSGTRLAESSVLDAVNLYIVSGEQLELRWPSEEFPILRAFPEPKSEVLFSVLEGSKIFTLSGDIFFRSGEIFYYDRNFLIQEGSIVLQEIAGRIDPLINLRANIRELADNGPVSISLIVEDDLLSQISPRLEATPALTQVEIANILGSNIYEQSNLNINDTDTAIQLAGDVISRLALLNTFENSLRNLLVFFDIFTIRTQIFQNILTNVFNANNPLYTNNVNSVAQYFNNTNLFLGKYLADYLYLELLVGLRYGPENNEVVVTSVQGLNVATEFAFELQSPLGALRWSLAPEIARTFKIESTLDLSWGFSY